MVMAGLLCVDRAIGIQQVASSETIPQFAHAVGATRIHMLRVCAGLIAICVRYRTIRYKLR